MAKLFNLGTNKQGLIVYGGESSTDYGMVVSEAPAYKRPTRKQTVYTVPGRNGSIVFQEDAWEDVPRPYNVFIAEDLQEDSGGNISGTLAERVDNFEAARPANVGFGQYTLGTDQHHTHILAHSYDTWQSSDQSWH